MHNVAMDDIVKQALLKWPNVPDCRGWLALDARGRWYLRDAATQARGDFPHAKGDWLQHAGLLAFIGRNYLADAEGQWYFQNGPQRVFVELEAAPWIWRVTSAGQVVSHTGCAVTVERVLLDEAGRVFLESDQGLGLVHTLDVAVVADLLERGVWGSPESVQAQALTARFGFVLSPQRHARAGSR